LKCSVLKKIKRALLSVSDKNGLEGLGKFLSEYGVEILSTGGTAEILSQAGVAYCEVCDYINFPEILNGRVKTLHPLIHGGILGIRSNDEHKSEMNHHGIDEIDLVVVNLYPFKQTVADGFPFSDCIEQIDIGGPSMIRSAAKNHSDVAVIVDPKDYQTFMKTMEDNNGSVPPDLRKSLAVKAFESTASYDAAISNWLRTQSDSSGTEKSFNLYGENPISLRYGENPHQDAVFYLTNEIRFGVASAKQIQGKELSYNNLIDSDAAYELVAEFDDPAVAIIKHSNPSGVAINQTLVEAYSRANACDPLSAFGGVVAMNRPLNKQVVEEISKIFTEVIIAPDADQDALEMIQRKKNVRVLLTGGVPDVKQEGFVSRTLAGGLLVQSRDNGVIAESELKVVTQRAPTKNEMQDLIFAWRVCKHVKSNAIVFAKNNVTTGIGAGQMSRIDSVRIARLKAEEVANNLGVSIPATRKSVVASDAFFPFPDGLVSAIEAGVTAAIQPGGSIKDEEVIAAADKAGIAMVFTGMRHFRH